MDKRKKRSACAISSMLDILGDKWSLLIIRDMIFHGKKTYGEFLSSGEKISTNILADRLSLLEKEGIITKEEHPDNKTKFLYELTAKGTELLPVLLEIVIWSSKYLEISDRAKELAKKAAKDRSGLIKNITEKYRHNTE